MRLTTNYWRTRTIHGSGACSTIDVSTLGPAGCLKLKLLVLYRYPKQNTARSYVRALDSATDQGSFIYTCIRTPLNKQADLGAHSQGDVETHPAVIRSVLASVYCLDGSSDAPP